MKTFTQLSNLYNKVIICQYLDYCLNVYTSYGRVSLNVLQTKWFSLISLFKSLSSFMG